MPVSKAQQKAVHKYVKAKYDRMELTVPKGRKDEIKAHAEAQGQSVNGFINTAIDHEMEKPPTSHENAPNLNVNGRVVQLPCETIKTAQDAAQSAGETVSQFVSRAVETQAKRDETARKLGGAHGD